MNTHPKEQRDRQQLFEAEVELLKCISEIVSAYLSNNTVAVRDLPVIIGSVRANLCGIDGLSNLKEHSSAQRAEANTQHDHPATHRNEKPAVSIKSSVKPTHIICLEDGKKFKTLKRHLASEHGLTPEQYKERWDLPGDYPMVASQYATRRSELAKVIGLGKSRQKRKKVG